jgi:hypothetical protein
VNIPSARLFPPVISIRLRLNHNQNPGTSSWKV